MITWHVTALLQIYNLETPKKKNRFRWRTVHIDAKDILKTNKIIFIFTESGWKNLKRRYISIMLYHNIIWSMTEMKLPVFNRG